MNLIVQNFPVPASHIHRTEVEMLSEIVNTLTTQIEDLSTKLTEVEIIYRNQAPDLVPLVYDMEQSVLAKNPKKQEKKVVASKATKMLWKRLSQQIHPDKIEGASEELRETFRSVFIKGTAAYNRNDSVTLKMLLDYVVKLKTSSNLKSMDSEDILEFKILDELKVSRKMLTDNLESLQTSSLAVVLKYHEAGDYEQALFVYKQHLIVTYHELKSGIRK